MVTKNGILLVDYTNQVREKTRSTMEALLIVFGPNAKHRSQVVPGRTGQPARAGGARDDSYRFRAHKREHPPPVRHARQDVVNKVRSGVLSATGG